VIRHRLQVFLQSQRSRSQRVAWVIQHTTGPLVDAFGRMAYPRGPSVPGVEAELWGITFAASIDYVGNRGATTPP
jgi:hypothetical protein